MAETEKSWEKFDQSRMHLAMQEIRDSENLRFFIRQVMAILNPLDYHGGTSETLAMQAGQHNAGVDFLGTLDAFDSGLWLEIQLEGVRENQSRQSGENDESS
jgi:hypothetical protein